MQRKFISATFAGALASIYALAAQAQENPFEKATQVATEWSDLLKGVVIAGATLAGIAVILAAMAGRLQVAWAFRIIVGLIALSGLPWIVQTVSGG